MKIYRTAELEYQFSKGDKVKFLTDIFDIDTGKLRVPAKSIATVLHRYNPEYTRVKLKDGETFSAYNPLIIKLCEDIKIGDTVTAVKDIYNMIGKEVYVKKGEQGEVKSLDGQDFIMVLFPSHRKDRPVGVHISEVEKI